MYKQCNIQKIGRAGQSSSHEDDTLQRYRNIMMNQQSNVQQHQQEMLESIGRVESDGSLPASLQRLQQPILVDIQDHITRNKKKLKRQRRRSSRKSRSSSVPRSSSHRRRRSSSSSSEDEESSTTSSKGCASLSEMVDVALTRMADFIVDSMGCESCADWIDTSTPSKCSVFENRYM